MMKKLRFTILFLLAVMLSASVCAGNPFDSAQGKPFSSTELKTSQAQSKSLQGKTILFVYGGWGGHDPVGCRDLLVPWMQSEGAQVIVSDSLGVYKDQALMDRVDVIVQTWTMGTITAEEERGLLRAVKGGAGIAGWHGGTGDAFRNNTEYQFMIGGQWVAHPGNQIDYVVNITDHTDPVTKGLDDFPMRSEQYYMHVDPNVKVLATTRFAGKAAEWIEGCIVPVVWKKHYGKGRVFYSSLAHTAADMQGEALTIMQRGICWAAMSRGGERENLVTPIYGSGK